MSDISQNPSRIVDISQNPSRIVDISQNPSRIVDISQNPSRIVDISQNPSRIVDISQNPSRIVDISQNPSRIVDIKYVIGSAVEPIPTSNKNELKIICHCTNTIGVWSAGFVLALSKKWPGPEREYLKLFDKEDEYTHQLGQVQTIQVSHDIIVANMFAQLGTYSTKDRDGNIIPPVRYNALRVCLQSLVDWIKHQKSEDFEVSVHLPRICSDLAGGKWCIVSKIIKDELCSKNIPVTVYDLTVNDSLKYTTDFHRFS